MVRGAGEARGRERGRWGDVDYALTSIGEERIGESYHLVRSGEHLVVVVRTSRSEFESVEVKSRKSKGRSSEVISQVQIVKLPLSRNPLYFTSTDGSSTKQSRVICQQSLPI